VRDGDALRRIGVSEELAHCAQNNSGDGGAPPQLPLGKAGTLALGARPLAWQVDRVSGGAWVSRHA